MKDILTWEDAHVFDYIKAIEFLYVPFVDDFQYPTSICKEAQTLENPQKIETPVFGYSEITSIFKDRYNERKLLKQNLYNEYIQTVGYLLKSLELDADKFWVLFLFALDYSKSIFYEGLTVKATPMEQLQTLVDMIEDANEPMILSFKVGKKKMNVESPIALRFLADAIQNQLNIADNTPLYARECEDEAKQISDSPIIVYFTKILLAFLDTQDHIKAKRKRGAKFSTKEMDLVSKLVYFSNLSTNRTWIDIENETLKAFLRQYKDYKYPNNVSSVYPEFVVY